MTAPRYRPEAFPIDPSIDEGTLTDEELQARYDAFRKITPRQPSQNISQLKDEVIQSLSNASGGATPRNVIEGWANFIVGEIQNGRRPDFNQIPSIDGYSPNRIRDDFSRLIPEFSDKFNRGSYSDPGVNADIKRLGELISFRQERAQKNQQVEDLLTQLPSDLEGRREEFVSGETGRVVERFQSDFVPRALETLNTRGALFSGDVEDLLTSEAFNVQSELNAFQSELEQQDNQFYFDAAYQNKVRQLMDTNQNLSNALNFERQNALIGQEQRFLQGQKDLDLRLNERLYQNDAERKLRLNEINLRRQQEAQERANRSRLIGGLGSAIGSTVGAVVGAKYGGGAGASVGSQVGGSLGGLGGVID